MEFEIVEKSGDVLYDVPQVKFPAYDEYKKKAAAVADYISTIKATSGNVKEAKAVLAKARKLTDRLTEERIATKKAILQNYDRFEAQVKEIVSIVSEAEGSLREKVRELDDAEREKKKEDIRNLWAAHVNFTIVEDVFPDAFNMWFTPRYLNKTVSMKTVESEMTEWIRYAIRDIDAASSMGTEYLAALRRFGSLAKAIEEVKGREAAAAALASVEEDLDNMPSASFVVSGNKDIALAERLLKENEIKFIRKDI